MNPSWWSYLATIATGIGATVILTIAAFGLGAVLAAPVTLARRSGIAPLRWLATAYIEIMRAIPPIVWLFIVFFGIGSSQIMIMSPMTASIIALGVVSSAYLAEIYRSGLDSVARGQWEAAAAIGLPRHKILWKVIAPQAVLVVTPPAGTYAVGLLKDSALASTIGVQDITFQAFNLTQQTLQGLTIFSTAAIVYVIVSIPIAVLSRWLDARFSRQVATA